MGKNVKNLTNTHKNIADDEVGVKMPTDAEAKPAVLKVPTSAIDMLDKKFEDIKKIKKNDKCCIIGFAPSWNEAPFNEKGIDFWGINELYVYLRESKIETPFAAWFEIHDIKNSPSKQNEQHQAFLKSCKIPLVTQKHWDEYPSSIAYPREYIKNYFDTNFLKDKKCTGFSDYSNQISWMIALAITLGYTEIMVYGVDMAQETEYAWQRASCQFFLGYGAGLGIKMRVPSSCQLLKAGRDYGFDTDNQNRHRKKSKIKVLNQQLQQMQIRYQEIQYYLNFLAKEKEEANFILKMDHKTLDREVHLLDQDIHAREFLVDVLNKMKIDLKPFTKQINQVKADVEKAKENRKNLLEQKEEAKKQRDKKIVDLDINIRVLKEEEEEILKVRYEVKGCIKECNHDLNNNLV